jgi:hypothetical protein
MDITMCENNLCPSKEYCFRFTAKPTKYSQSYANFVVKENDVDCVFFWANGKDSDKCKLKGTRKQGQMCNRKECDFPNCTKDDYCKECHQPNNVHKMSCSSQKITMFYDQMEKEVHKNNSNLNQ